MKKHLNLRANIALGLIFAFLANTLGPLPSARADEFLLPAPGQMVPLSQPYSPAVLKGIKLDPNNPFKFDFYVDTGDEYSRHPEQSEGSQQEQLKQESSKLIKYFLSSLTIPERDLWVNLSPYEKDRIVPKEFGQTEMGRDLLAEDYLLKQITASLIYPESRLGRKFWAKVYTQAQAKYGTTNIPINTFNKVWIVPDKAVVYENGGTAFVLENHLKVMLEQDYLSLAKHSNSSLPQDGRVRAGGQNINALGSQVVREIVIPALTKEVNEGKNFSQLRQVFYSLILATWYKKKIKDSILNKIYSDQKKVQNLSSPNASVKDPQHIYQQYLQAFKKGVFKYIKEEPDPITGQKIPRKYFSGGVEAWEMDNAMSIVGPEKTEQAISELKNSAMIDVRGDFKPIQMPTDRAMTNIPERLIYDQPVSQAINLDVSQVAQKVRNEIEVRGLKDFKKAEPLYSNHEQLNVYQLSPGVRIIEKPIAEEEFLIIKKLVDMGRPGLVPIFFVPGEKRIIYELDLRPFNYMQLISEGKEFLNTNRLRIIKAVENTFRFSSQHWFFHGHLHWKNILIRVNKNGVLEDIKFIDLKHLAEITPKKEALMLQIEAQDPVNVIRKQTGQELPFEWWDLRGKRFDGLVLHHWGFYNCDLTRASFVGTKLDAAYFIQSTLKDVNFTNAYLMNAEFKGADVASANFQGITAQLHSLLQAPNILEALPNRTPKIILDDVNNDVRTTDIMDLIFSGFSPIINHAMSSMKENLEDQAMTNEEQIFFKEWEDFFKNSTGIPMPDSKLAQGGVRHIVYFYPRPFKIGGAKTYQRNVIRSLLKSNKDLTIELIYFNLGDEPTRAVFEDPRKNNRLILRGVPIKSKEETALTEQETTDLVVKEIKTIQNRQKIDLIALNSSTPDAYLLSKILALANQLQVASHYYFHGGAITKNTRFLIEYADVAVTNSKFYKNIFSGLGMEKVRLLYPVSDMREDLNKNLSAVRKIKERYGLLGRKIILHPGRITSKKGQEMTIRAAGQLLKEHPNLTSQIAVVILGPEGNPKGGDRLRLRKLARELGVDVLFVDGQSAEKMWDWYDASYVVIYPTLSAEPFGLVPVEAQSRGVPVIASNGGGLAETLKDGKTGYLSEQGNYFDLAHKMFDLIVNEDKRNEMGEAGIQYTQEQFSSRQTVQNISISYLEAMKVRKKKNLSENQDIDHLIPKGPEAGEVLSNVYYLRAPIKGEGGIIQKSVFDATDIYEPGDSELVRNWKRVWFDKLNQSKMSWGISDNFTSPFNDGGDVAFAFDPLLIPIRSFGNVYERIILSSGLRKGSYSVLRDTPQALENKIFPPVNDINRWLFEDPFDPDFVVLANLYPKVEFDSLIFSKQWKEQRLTPQAVQLQINWVRGENVVTDFHRRLAFVPHLHFHLNAPETVRIIKFAGTFHSIESFRDVEIGELDYPIEHIALRSGNEEALKEVTIFFADHFEEKKYLFTQTMFRDPETNEPIVLFIIYKKGIELINFSSAGFIKLSNAIQEDELLKNFEEQAISRDELTLIKNEIWNNWKNNVKAFDYESDDKAMSTGILGDVPEDEPIIGDMDTYRKTALALYAAEPKVNVTTINDHVRRVVDLSRLLGARMLSDRRDRELLEQAALIHDLEGNGVDRGIYLAIAGTLERENKTHPGVAIDDATRRSHEDRIMQELEASGFFKEHPSLDRSAVREQIWHVLTDAESIRIARNANLDVSPVVEMMVRYHDAKNFNLLNADEVRKVFPGRFLNKEAEEIASHARRLLQYLIACDVVEASNNLARAQSWYGKPNGDFNTKAYLLKSLNGGQISQSIFDTVMDMFDHDEQFIRIINDARRNPFSTTGGIDLNPAQMSLQVKKEGEDFKFNFNGTEIDAAQVTGATFTIRSMTPVTDLPSILGLAK